MDGKESILQALTMREAAQQALIRGANGNLGQCEGTPNDLMNELAYQRARQCEEAQQDTMRALTHVKELQDIKEAIVSMKKKGMFISIGMLVSYSIALALITKFLS
jgi:hypothetical protein